MVKQAFNYPKKNALDINKFQSGRIFDSQQKSSKLTISGQSITLEGVSTCMASQKVRLKPFTVYTINAVGSTNNQAYVYKTDGTIVASGTFNPSKTFTTSGDSEYIVALYKPSGLGTNPITYTNVQLEEGSLATSFENYIPLNKINNKVSIGTNFIRPVAMPVDSSATPRLWHWVSGSSGSQTLTIKGDYSFDYLHPIASAQGINYFFDYDEIRNLRGKTVTFGANITNGVVSLIIDGVFSNTTTSTSGEMKTFTVAIPQGANTLRLKLQNNTANVTASFNNLFVIVGNQYVPSTFVEGAKPFKRYLSSKRVQPCL